LIVFRNHLGISSLEPLLLAKCVRTKKVELNTAFLTLTNSYALPQRAKGYTFPVAIRWVIPKIEDRRARPFGSGGLHH